MKLNKSTFAKLNGVSRAAITLAVKSGSLVVNAQNMIDQDHPINAAWLSRRNVKSNPVTVSPKKQPKKLQKKEALPNKSPDPAPKPIIAELDIDELPDDGLSDDDMGALSIAKVKAEIRFKNEQADTALQKRLERLGQLVEREQVEKIFGNLGAEIKLRLLEMPARITPRIIAMSKSGAEEKEIQQFFEDEISLAIIELKRRLTDGLKTGVEIEKITE